MSELNHLLRRSRASPSTQLLLPATAKRSYGCSRRRRRLGELRTRPPFLQQVLPSREQQLYQKAAAHARLQIFWSSLQLRLASDPGCVFVLRSISRGRRPGRWQAAWRAQRSTAAARRAPACCRGARVGLTSSVCEALAWYNQCGDVSRGRPCFQGVCQHVSFTNTYVCCRLRWRCSKLRNLPSSWRASGLHSSSECRRRVPTQCDADSTSLALICSDYAIRMRALNLSFLFYLRRGPGPHPNAD